MLSKNIEDMATVSQLLKWILLLHGLLIALAEQPIHPNLYFSSRDISRLQEQALTTHRDIFVRLKEAATEMKKEPSRFLPPRDWEKFASRWNEDHGNNFGALAMYCVLNNQDLLARDVAMQFFDAFVSLPNWRVRASMVDDVPVAHSLVAVATAYDFMYEHLNDTLRSKVLQKVSEVSKELYKRSFNLSWGTQYIQNHVATNYVAFFTGALVVENHNKEATIWKERAHVMLNRTMFLLNHVVDGSMEEGVAYGSYTSRSLTQYIFLVKRHLGLDLTNNIWLRQHFWFLYRTILPGFTETVGIADSNSNWFYGPESQLVFLDNFVMRNGYGNWLASNIRRLRLEDLQMKGSFGHRYCTLHTEFLFFDASISEKEPPNAYIPQLHIFQDWGVATYGGGTLDTDGQSSTFLSFKSSVLHGRAVNEIVRRKPYDWISGWRNFNPGHEHPDQGSFVFAPNGVPFVTEALYGPKYTWLNNVLLFGPTNKPTCSGPFEGQIGDCGKWMNYKDEKIWFVDAGIVASSQSDEVVFMSGEMSGWYSPSLGLISVYRAILLLRPGVLLVVDHIETRPDSPTRYVGAFFHNKDSPFELQEDKDGEVSGSITLYGEKYLVLFGDSHRGHSIVHSQHTENRAESGLRKTHFLNITTKLKQKQTRLAYVFVAPGNKVTIPQVQDDEIGVHVSLDINGLSHLVSIATKYNSLQTRRTFLGFDGFASVKVNSKCVMQFGLNEMSTRGISKRASCRVHSFTTTLFILFGLIVCFAVFNFVILSGSRRGGFKCVRGIFTPVFIFGLILIWSIVSVFSNKTR